jgi:hypothetical protein
MSRRICEKLAENQVNIGEFALGRKQKGQMAMGVLVIDEPISDELLKEVAKYADIRNATQISLGDEIDPSFRVNTSNHVNGSNKPSVKPISPEFSSGPCKKRPGYELSNLRTDVLGRSHRSKVGINRVFCILPSL